MPVWLEVSARTSAEAAEALGIEVGQVAKSVVFRRKADDVLKPDTARSRTVDASTTRGEPEPNAPVPSPCNSICRMNATTGWCEGCWRTIDEIVAWGSLDDVARRAVWAEIAMRRD